jgi:phosphatidylserine decarboxylase
MFANPARADTLCHQYIDRTSGAVRTERLFADRLIQWLYATGREQAPVLFNALISRRMSALLGGINFDLPLGQRLTGAHHLLADLGVDLAECLLPAAQLDTPRKVFERQIRYWQCRPMPADPAVVVAPADAKMVTGSLAEESTLFIKEKFFHFNELLGAQKRAWLAAFDRALFAVFRLTPEKYHYNHLPVTGRVVDHYYIEGAYHSCNPAAVVAVMTPFSKNRRCVTVIDTDVPNGTGIGLVAMIEIVALMIGGITQCYSEMRYEAPRPLHPGIWVFKGQPKSLYRPGSSVDVLLFQAGRMQFDADLVANQYRTDARSRFVSHFQRPLVETDIQVRASIGCRLPGI